MPSSPITTSGFGLSALPAYDPQDPRRFVTNPNQSFQGGLQSASAGQQLIGQAQQQQLQGIQLDKAKKDWQDEQDTDKLITDTNVEMAKKDPDEWSPFAKLLSKLQANVPFPIRGQQDLFKGIDYSVKSNQAQQDAAYKNAQTQELLARAQGSGGYKPQATSLVQLGTRQDGSPVWGVFSPATGDVKPIQTEATTAKSSTPAFSSFNLGLDANGNVIRGVLDKRTGDIKAADNLPQVKSMTQAKSPDQINQESLVRTAGSNGLNVDDFKGDDGAIDYTKLGDATYKKLQEKGDFLGQLGLAFGINNAAASSSAPAATSPAGTITTVPAPSSASAMKYGKRPDGTYGLIPANAQ